LPQRTRHEQPAKSLISQPWPGGLAPPPTQGTLGREVDDGKDVLHITLVVAQ
jgi:hypothetical protein